MTSASSRFLDFAHFWIDRIGSRVSFHGFDAATSPRNDRALDVIVGGQLDLGRPVRRGRTDQA
jgi:hypothetical protein